MIRVFFNPMNSLRNIFLVGFFSVLILIGLGTYKDFGVGVDEPVERMNGAVSLNYIADLFHISWLQKNPNLAVFRDLDLTSYKDRDYPVAFNLPLVALEQILKIEDDQQIYFFRHLVNYFVCLLGVYALFRLAERRYHDWRIGLLAATFFILSPRFFPEFFYNSKDLIFLTFFALGANSLVKFVLAPGSMNALIHACMTALAINIRIMGILLVVVTLGILVVRILRQKSERLQILLLLIMYLALTLLVTIFCWPWLWSNPIENLIEGFHNMAHFRQAMPVWYMGIPDIVSNNIPWHYIPLWILMSTPIFYVTLFIFGLGSSIKVLLTSKFLFWKNDDQLQDIIFLGLFLVPIISVIALNSVLYNAWRQLFFVYPFFLLIAIKGWVSIWSPSSPRIGAAVIRLMRYSLVSISALSLAWTLGWMIKTHPYENFYLNGLAGKAWYEDFAGDYWGITNRNTLEFIARNDDRSYVQVAGAFFLDAESQLNVKDRAKIVRANSIEDADYLLNDLHHPEFKPVHEVFLDGQLLASASRRIKDGPPIVPIGLNQKIFFAKDGGRLDALIGVGQQPLTGAGWAYPEEWGVWLDGTHAKLLLPMPQPKPASLELTVRAFISPGKEAQIIDIFVNRIFAKSISLHQPENVTEEIALSKKMLEFNYVQVELRPKGPLLSPKDLGMGDDERKLSLGLVSLVFH